MRRRRRDDHARQTVRDVERATDVVMMRFALNHEEASRALVHGALSDGISIHAAALAVIADGAARVAALLPRG